MKGPALVVFRIPTLGCSFQVLGKNDGRLMLVFQSTRVSNVSPYRTCRIAPVVSGRSYAWRPWTLTSVTLMLFPQFHRPTRSGVLRFMVVRRLSLKSGTVSGRSYAWRPWTLTSVTLMLFPQFHRPTRSGVLRFMVVRRLSLKSGTVSGTTLSRGTPTVSPAIRSVLLETWNCWSLLKLNPGDQVIQGVMFTADGVRLMVGKVWLT